jgi:hypothetical protein
VLRLPVELLVQCLDATAVTDDDGGLLELSPRPTAVQ